MTNNNDKILPHCPCRGHRHPCHLFLSLCLDSFLLSSYHGPLLLCFALSLLDDHRQGQKYSVTYHEFVAQKERSTLLGTDTLFAITD